MKHTSILSVRLLLTAIPLSGQVFAPTIRGACPVELRATHERGEALRSASPSSEPEQISQKLTLAFHNAATRDIVSAQITARGYSSKGQVLRLQPGVESAPGFPQSIKVPLSLKAKGDEEAVFTFKDFTAVTALEIVTVSYADGTSWRAAEGFPCIIRPDAFMPVNEIDDTRP